MDVPVITTADVELPNVRIVEEPVEVIDEIEVPVEKVVDKVIEVPEY